MRPLGSSSSSSSWDPCVRLSLGHPALLFLEKHCRSGHHFREIVGHMLRLHLAFRTFPMSRLLCFAAAPLRRPHLLPCAALLFRHFTPNPNLFIFNTMISAASPWSPSLYASMLSLRILPDERSLLPLLVSCPCLPAARQIHAQAIAVVGLRRSPYLRNSLLRAYMDCGDIDAARRVFDGIPHPDSVSYNCMVSGLARRGCSSEAFQIFQSMVRSGVEFDAYTAVGLLQACGQLENAVLGKFVHGLVLRRGMSLSQPSLILGNALMGMYSKRGEMGFARRVFETLGRRDAVSWNTIVSGFATTGEMGVACRYFDKAPVRDLVSWNSLLRGFVDGRDWGSVRSLVERMSAEKVEPDEITSAALLSAASGIGALNQGRCVHGWVLKAHGSSDAFLGSALIDMYSKCGNCDSSLRVFKLIGDKDVAAWTALIAGLAFHGHGSRALEMFGKMQEKGLLPNRITMIAVLTACSHSGLVDQGLKVFGRMEHEYGIKPEGEHYGCLVDLLARSGKLAEATEVIRRMPAKPSRSMWGAILSASRARGDMKLSVEASEKLAELAPGEDGGYVLLSNAYASCGRWNDSGMVRGVMEGRGIKKVAGWSSVVIDGVIHAFVSSNKGQHPSWGGIFDALCQLHREMNLLANI